MAKRIPLSQGKFATVDDDDYEEFSVHRWCYRAGRDGTVGCAVRNVKRGGVWRLAYLHREIMCDPEGMEVIFLNHDRLDCRRDNLKVLTRTEASWHHRPRKDSCSGVKGVRYNESSGRWYASITRRGGHHHLGTFPTRERAIKAYREAHEWLESHPSWMELPDKNNDRARGRRDR